MATAMEIMTRRHNANCSSFMLMGVNKKYHVGHHQQQQQHDHVGRHPHPARPFNSTYVQTMERGNIYADNGEGEGHCVGNVIHSGRVDIVIVDRRPASPSLQVQPEQQQQLQPERDPIMAMEMEIMTCRQQHSCIRARTRIADQQVTPLHHHGHTDE